ncbi:KEX1 [Candida margitis]|uniref:KEX1 n=1 Tax=Candida margitis TaxID=1775924 RepID=UPI002226CE5A|nr:KEX1 [Candida margitis]KAI5969098.1 KEX1 [Candida margitis]
MVYVDQPPMVGFSDGELIRNLNQVQIYFLRFLEKYFALFPEDLQNDIYIAGESYAGQYIPYVADAILKRNENLTDGDDEYKLKAVLIGNGIVSPDEQSLSYVDWFKEKSLIDDSNPNWSQINDAQKACQDVLDGTAASPNENYAFSCHSILQVILNATRNESAPADQQCVNVYDYQLRDSFPSCGSSYPPVTELITPYLNSSKIQNDLNVNHPVNFTECNTKVQETFTATNSPPAKVLLPGIVSQIPIIVYNGDLDIICNSNGVLSYLSNLTWNGATGFDDANNRTDWIVEDKKAGWVLQDRDLTFINIFNASHLVPYSRPLVSRYLFDFATDEYTKNDKGFVSSPKDGLK